MLPLICFLLHPNRLDISKIIPQNVNDHLYYTGLGSWSFYPVAYERMCLLRMSVDVDVGVWVHRGAFIGVFGYMHT